MDQSIAEILEQCRQRMARGESIERCLAAYPAHSAELSELLPVVARAQSLASDPDPVYSARARQRFSRSVAAARSSRQEMAKSGSGLMGWLQNLLIPVAIVIVVVISGFGLVQASQDTLPGSPLYPVKQAQEGITQVFSRGPENKAIFQMKIAARRLAELQMAERMKKGPAVLGPLAVQMVEASTAATRQIAQTTGQRHAVLVANMRRLLRREYRGLLRFTKSPNPEVAATARRLLEQIQLDEQSLGK